MLAGNFIIPPNRVHGIEATCSSIITHSTQHVFPSFYNRWKPIVIFSLFFTKLIICPFLTSYNLHGFNNPKKRSQPTLSPTVLKRINLREGVEYTHEYYPRTRWSVHILKIDLRNPDLQFTVMKGLNRISGLEKVHDIMHRFDSLNPSYKVIAGVNANFWKAGSNLPIGPAVSDGVFINSSRYKNWSSLIIGEKNQMYIDRLDPNIKIRFKDTTFLVNATNHRTDSGAACLYNKFYGPSLPFIDSTHIIFDNIDQQNDGSEIDRAGTQILDSLVVSNPETGTVKVAFKYLNSHFAVNTSSRAVIIRSDTLTLDIPLEGGILSLGYNRSLMNRFLVGDTFDISTSLGETILSPASAVITGTPRIVRNGAINVEWLIEGLRKYKFIIGKYARTGIGLNRSRTKCILITVESTRKSARTRGISLSDMARLFIRNNAFDAFNLDGGSSSTMILNTQDICSSCGYNPSRRVSMSLLLIAPDRDKNK